MTAQTLAALVLGVVIVAFIGAYALLYPGSQGGLLALGALLPLAGAIGTFFFHSASQTFLGTQLAAQRELTVQAMNTPPPASGTASTTWTGSQLPAPVAGPTSPSTGTTMRTTDGTPPPISGN